MPVLPDLSQTVSWVGRLTLLSLLALQHGVCVCLVACAGPHCRTVAATLFLLSVC